MKSIKFGREICGLLLAKLDETALYDGRAYPLFTNRWAGGEVDPHGYRHIESFRLKGMVPVWRLSSGHGLGLVTRPLLPGSLADLWPAR